MRILITGATGFVGGYLAAELAAHYPQAQLFGTTYGQTSGALLPDNMPLLEADLREPAKIRQALEQSDPDFIFHLAGFASGAGTDAAVIRAANVDATKLLVEAVAERGKPCRLHLASTGYVYGTTEPGKPAREDDTLRPEGPYAQSKAEMETEIAPLASGSLSITVTRAFNHTGPRQTPVFVAPGFARQLARIERGLDTPVVRVGNLEAKRDFLDVRDVVRAYRLLLCELEPAPWRVVNVASGDAVAIQTILDTLLGFAKVDVSVELDPARLRPSDMPQCIGSSALLSSLTGWRTTHSLTDTLLETLTWWRSTGVDIW
ncbi:GDP-mannose 4,6-dehydratase [Armatimonas rosea]|uniref:GDP-4-dehydro-6-deoxy-D-mannose reductase n=1 Tax=Armatimonas rosea TaxID=685828 RepID=A0A7W9W746_ARMRO|nr:GDP-mannose 4,6-dehydratase [Armatimonas rosea]MBB6052084.1 GDP-4-dehydro-6-deoxy-D-mannose reductase [Armatimonas rosea]